MGKYAVHRTDANAEGIYRALAQAGASVYRGGPPFICKRCETVFYLPPKRRNNPSRGRYCSIVCKRLNHAGTSNPNYRGIIEITCAGCGKAFVSPRRKVTRRYCSLPCYLASAEALAHNKAVAGMGQNRGCRTDANHAEIVAAFRQAGASVYDASPMGKGFPDLIVGHHGKNHLVEIKNPQSSYGRAGLSKRQADFAATWAGAPVMIIRTVEEGLKLIGVTGRY